MAVTRTMREWLQAVAFLILQDVMQQRGVTAAGYATSPDEAVDVATAAYNDWRRGVDNNVLPAVSIAFGEGFQQVRLRNRGTGSFQAQQDYMETVADRLRIWPEGAFEKLRPELVEALAEAESIEQIKDRVGRVLEIDTDSRDIKARINEVEIELTDPMLDTQTRRDLRAVRRELWAEHDEALSRWEWKARRIARTEAHGAVNAGQLAAAREAEVDTGENYHKRWLATEDVRTRATHRVADGQTVPLSGKFRVGGFLLDFPGDPIVIAPHETINCRCTMTILDPDALQDALQGPDSSLGEVRPGGIRLGTDDPDDAMQAIVENAADEHRQLPPDVEARGENHGQQPPPATPDVELTDDRDEPVFAEPTPADVDLTGKTDDELLQLMMDSADDLDGVYEAARDEYDRRTLLSLDRPDEDHDDDRQSPELEDELDDDVIMPEEFDIPYEQIATAPDLLTQDEYDAIESYAISGYGQVNAALRGQIPMTDRLSRLAERIRSGLQKYPLARTIRVTRRTEADVITQFDPAEPDLLILQRATFPGFLSTSMLSQPRMLRADDVILDLIVPEGTPAFALGELAEFDLEKELLLIDARTVLFIGVVFEERIGTWRLIGVVDGEGE